MSKKDEREFVEMEESQMTPPEDVGAELELKTEDQEAMEAMRKFTDEDSDEMGEISVKSILGGDFLMSKFMMKQVAFVMFCVVLMLLYTGNRYDSQQDAILIDSLREHLQVVKYNVLTQSSELMNLTRQSNVEKALKNTGDSLLHNSITPPYLIKTGAQHRLTDVEEPEEVLVGEGKRDSVPQDDGMTEDEPEEGMIKAENQETKTKQEDEVR
ncbi:MAG: hypothetical protein IJP82_04725 [Bacteroidaceae bacterium]|nr:hypothetical protein [Bacteroidaceae bacterium]